MKRIANYILLLLATGSSLFSQVQLYPSDIWGNLSSFDDDELKQISIYSFGSNPAGIVDFNQKAKMRAASWAEYRSGDFRRRFDPQSRFMLFGFAETIRPMSDSISVFRGYMQYYTENMNQVFAALEYKPYQNTFTAIDTSIGSFDYYGPKLGFEYGRKLTSRVSAGIHIDYGLQSGLKREPSKTKIDGRFISGKIGLDISLPLKTKLGVLYQLFSNQYRLNANRAFLPDYPVIYRFYGDSLLIKNEAASLFDRKLANDGFSASVQLLSEILSRFKLGGKVSKFIDSHVIAENVSEGRLDIDDFGSFQRSGESADIVASFQADNFPIQVISSYSWQKWNLWARTPRYQTIFETMNGNERTWKLKLWLRFKVLPLQVMGEYCLRKFEEEKQNYFCHYDWRRDIKASWWQIAAKVQLFRNISFNGSAIRGKTIPEYHLTMNPVNFSQTTAGIRFYLGKYCYEFSCCYKRVFPQNKSLSRKHLLFWAQFIREF